MAQRRSVLGRPAGAGAGRPQALGRGQIWQFWEWERTRKPRSSEPLLVPGAPNTCSSRLCLNASRDGRLFSSQSSLLSVRGMDRTLRPLRSLSLALRVPRLCPRPGSARPIAYPPRPFRALTARRSCLVSPWVSAVFLPGRAGVSATLLPRLSWERARHAAGLGECAHTDVS